MASKEREREGKSGRENGGERREEKRTGWPLTCKTQKSHGIPK